MDGSLDLWDADSVPLPWSPPLNCLCITTDASASGFGFFLGSPARPRILWAGLWTLAQSVNSSNWREYKAVSLALSILSKTSPSSMGRRFILLRTDNTCTKAFVNTFSSKTSSLVPIASTVRRFIVSWAADIAAVHVKGLENTLADTASRLAEDLYRRRCLSVPFLRWMSEWLAFYSCASRRRVRSQPPITPPSVHPPFTGDCHCRTPSSPAYTCPPAPLPFCVYPLCTSTSFIQTHY